MNTPNTPKPEAEVSEQLSGQKSLSSPCGTVRDFVQTALKITEVLGEWQRRHFMIVEDDPRINESICDELRKKRLPENKIVGVFDGESAENAIDQFLSQAQEGECLTLICDMEFPDCLESLPNPSAGRSVILYALRAFKQWKESHPTVTNQPKLEILINSSRISSSKEFRDFTDSFTDFESEIASSFVGFSPKKDGCLDVLQTYFLNFSSE